VKQTGKLCLCLAGTLVWCAGLHAGGAPAANNPYASIATRNVFDIHPLPPVDPNKPPVEPPPKITPNGIVSASGHVQVLFKVTYPAKPRQPAHDQSYMLSEGQQEDDIAVTKIDEKAEVVTFLNHGTSQDIPLAGTDTSASGGSPPGGPTPTPTPAYSVPPQFVPGGGNINNGGPIHFGSRFGQSGGSTPNVVMGGNNYSGNAGGAYNSSYSTFGNASAGSGSQFAVAVAGGNSYSGTSGATSPSGSQPNPFANLTPEQKLALALEYRARVPVPPMPSGPQSQQ